MLPNLSFFFILKFYLRVFNLKTFSKYVVQVKFALNNYNPLHLKASNYYICNKPIINQLMFAKFAFLLLFIIAEIALGIYSLAMSESLMAKFLFFLLSAIIVCALVMKLSNHLLPDDDRREKNLKRNTE